MTTPMFHYMYMSIDNYDIVNEFLLHTLISACETNSSQAIIKFTGEHSNHGKHCHHKIEFIIKQHSKQDHSHDT